MSAILPPALRQLLWVRMIASARRLLRSLKTAKGIVYLIGIVCVFSWWLIPLLFFGRGGNLPPGTLPDHLGTENVKALMAPGLLLLTVTMLLAAGPESGIFFFPEEIDLLFPGPFRRRDILLYRLAGWAMSLVVLSLMSSVVFVRLGQNWIYGLYGTFLVLNFGQLLQTCLHLLISSIGARAYTRGRKIAIIVVLALLAMTLSSRLQQHSLTDLGKLVDDFRSSQIGWFLLAPFEVFARTILAERFFPDFVGWGSLALLVDAALIGIILRLDTDFFEASTVASQKMYQRIQLARQGQGWKSFSRPTQMKVAMAMFPRWRGAGPVAWKQCLTALRGMRGIALFLGVISLSFLAPVLVAASLDSTRPEPAASTLLPIIAAPLIALSVFLLPQMLQFDFRGDLEHMDVLKSLPMSPTAIVLGQLFTPTVLATALQWLVLGLLAALTQHWDFTLTTLVIASPAVNLVMFIIENLIFLWYPLKPSTAAGFDIQAMGQQMILMSFKLLLLGALGVAIGLCVVFTWWLTDGSAALSIAAGMILVATFCVATVPLVGDAFRRFDPSLDTGE